MANLSAFSLSFDFHGAPGLGGTARLSVAPSQAGITVIDELPGEGPDFRRRQKLPAHSGWRGVVSYLVANSIVAFDTGGDLTGEYPWPYAMYLKGRPSLAPDMIAIAWAGEPMSHIARVLSAHDDATLESLRTRYGSLKSKNFIEALMRVNLWCDEFLVDFDDILARGPRFDFDFRLMRKDAVAMARVVRAEEEATKLRRAWSLTPFEPRIAEIVLAWRRANPATSTNTQIGLSMRSGILQRGLERHVIEHGELPSGVLRIRNDRPEWSISDFDVDVGTLEATMREVIPAAG